MSAEPWAQNTGHGRRALSPEGTGWSDKDNVVRSLSRWSLYGRNGLCFSNVLRGSYTSYLESLTSPAVPLKCQYCGITDRCDTSRAHRGL
jgi:hypothetical protein